METNKNDKKVLPFLYREVIKVPLITLLPDNKPPKGKTHAILDKETGDILHFCSKEYILRSNHFLFKPFEHILFNKNYNFTIQPRIVEQTKFYVDYIIHSPIDSILGEFLPKFSIWNSYDGTVKTQIKFGFIHLVGSNTMTRPTDCNGKNCSDLNLEENTINEFWDKFNIFIKESKQDISIFEKLNKKRGSPDTIENIGLKLRLSPQIRELAIKKFENNVRGGFTFLNSKGQEVIHQGYSFSLFNVYSCLNYGIYNCNDKELPDYKLKRDRNLISEFLQKK